MVLASFLSKSWYFKAMDYIYRFFFRLKTIFSYVKLAWNDHDYDWVYLMLVLQYKLKRMRVHFVKHNIVERAQEYGVQIKDLEDTIERILDGNYCAQEYASHYAKWGKITFDRESIMGGKLTRIKLRMSNVKTEEDENNEREEHFKIMEEYEKQKTNDIKKLFDTMRDNIQNWWD